MKRDLYPQLFAEEIYNLTQVPAAIMSKVWNKGYVMDKANPPAFILNTHSYEDGVYHLGYEEKEELFK